MTPVLMKGDIDQDVFEHVIVVGSFLSVVSKQSSDRDLRRLAGIALKRFELLEQWIAANAGNEVKDASA